MSEKLPLRQVVPNEVWPSGDGRTTMIITLNPVELSENYLLSFLDGMDDLDRYTVAAIELSEGRQAWLFRHENAPEPGCEVIADMNDDFPRVNREVISILGLSPNNIVWIHPTIPVDQMQ